MSFSQKLRQRTIAWFARGVRVSLGVVVVGGALTAVAGRVSYARASDVGLNFGEELRSLGEGRLSGTMSNEAYELSLNGQPFDTNTAASHKSMAELLDFFQTECNTNSDGLGDELGHLDTTLHAQPKSTKGVPGYMTIRKESVDKSFIFCIAPDHELTTKEAFGRMSEVAKYGDVGRLGDVRYISVMKDQGGSTVSAMWTHGTMNVSAMFPSVGDAPGEDLGSVPRPDGARRVLTGHIIGAPYGVNVYQVAGKPAAALEAVDAKLQASGYKPVAIPDEVKAPAKFYTLGNAMDVEVIARGTHGGKTDVAYMVSRAIGTVSR
jgi:hypothetical protein